MADSVCSYSTSSGKVFLFFWWKGACKLLKKVSALGGFKMEGISVLLVVVFEGCWLGHFAFWISGYWSCVFSLVVLQNNNYSIFSRDWVYIADVLPTSINSQCIWQMLQVDMLLLPHKVGIHGMRGSKNCKVFALYNPFKDHVIPIVWRLLSISWGGTSWNATTWLNITSVSSCLLMRHFLYKVMFLEYPHRGGI